MKGWSVTGSARLNYLVPAFALPTRERSDLYMVVSEALESEEVRIRFRGVDERKRIEGGSKILHIVQCFPVFLITRATQNCLLQDLCVCACVCVCMCQK